jgi:hypothetical protein
MKKVENPFVTDPHVEHCHVTRGVGYWGPNEIRHTYRDGGGTKFRGTNLGFRPILRSLKVKKNEEG